MSEFLQSKEGLNTLITATVALIAAAATVIGPYVSTKISRRQTTATLRQQWIDRLRETIAEFVAIVNQYILLHTVPLDTPENVSLYRRLLHLEATIKLMLNRHEEDHKNLIKLMGSLLEAVHNDTLPREVRIVQMSTLHNGFIQVSQDILKREWVRVKSG